MVCLQMMSCHNFIDGQPLLRDEKPKVRLGSVFVFLDSSRNVTSTIK